MNFMTWLTTFVEEKGIDREDLLEVATPVQDHLIPTGVVIENCLIASREEQAFIKDTIVKIDFRNGDVMHFFRHLATCIARQYDNV